MGCAHCKRKVTWEATNEFTGHPYGWYRLSQRVPLTASRGGIRTLGWYCSLNCLGHAVLQQEHDPVNKEYDHE